MIFGKQINPDSLIINTGTKRWVITNDSHRFYDKIRNHLRDGEDDEAEALLDVTAHVEDFGDGRVTVVDGLIQFEDRSIGNKMSEYMFRMMDEGFTITPLVNFLTNLRKNPSNRAVNELYTFMDVNGLPLTDDGHFLAYKFVSEDYKDCHTGTVDNSIGQKPFMERNLVDEDKARTCSHGFHFCSLAYLQGGWGNRWMVVKVNPADVVAIPADYNNTKARCNTYEVIAELEVPQDVQNRREAQSAFSGVVDREYDYDDDDYECDECGSDECDVDRCDNEDDGYVGNMRPGLEQDLIDVANGDAVAVNPSTLNDRARAIRLGTEHGQLDTEIRVKRKTSYDNERDYRNPVELAAYAEDYTTAYEAAYDKRTK